MKINETITSLQAKNEVNTQMPHFEYPKFFAKDSMPFLQWSTHYVDSVFGQGATEALKIHTNDIPAVIGAMHEVSEGYGDNSVESQTIVTALVQSFIDEYSSLSPEMQLSVVGYRERLIWIVKNKKINNMELYDLLSEYIDEQRQNSAGFIKPQPVDDLTAEKVAREEAALNAPFKERSKMLGAAWRPLIVPDELYESIDSLVDEVNDGEDEFDTLIIDGLCQQIDPGINTGEHVLNRNEAKQVCGMCHFSKICLEYALNNKIDWGIWGGKGSGERREMLRAQREAALKS